MENDFIRRQAAINIFCHDDCEDCPDGGCEMYRRLKRLPAADVRPVVRGKWIEEYECTHPQAKCSACGEPTLYAVSYDIKGNAYYMNFCPNCGADMREESNEK